MQNVSGFALPPPKKKRSITFDFFPKDRFGCFRNNQPIPACPCTRVLLGIGTPKQATASYWFPTSAKMCPMFPNTPPKKRKTQQPGSSRLTEALPARFSLGRRPSLSISSMRTTGLPQPVDFKHLDRRSLGPGRSARREAETAPKFGRRRNFYRGRLRECGLTGAKALGLLCDTGRLLGS